MKRLKKIRNAYAIPAKLRSGAGYHTSINKYPSKQEDIKEREEEMNHKMWPPAQQAKFQELLSNLILYAIDYLEEVEPYLGEGHHYYCRGKAEAYTECAEMLKDLLKEEGLI